MNWIQRSIIGKFLFTKELRLGQLRPRQVESNLFSYHLNLLIKDGLITRVSHGKYVLTPKGQHQAGLISKSSGRLTKQPKIALMIFAKNNHDEYLLFRWKRQPYLDQVSLPYGKLHFGDNPAKAANEELEEKTGLSGRLTFGNDSYVRITTPEIILTHMLVHVYQADNLKGELRSSVSGDPFWSKIKNNMDYVPGFHDLLRHIESDNQDLIEISSEL
jgi:ADP-ribose pyrophosphatase YjhB (NUDIX family)